MTFEPYYTICLRVMYLECRERMASGELQIDSKTRGMGLVFTMLCLRDVEC